MQMKILFADDHTLFRDALVEYIERAEPSASVAIARDMHEAMEKLEQGDTFDIILLDFRMPGMNGMQGLEKIRAAYPDIPVAILSGLAEKLDIERALETGAVGYFPKTLSGKQLLQGIRSILEGGTFVAIDHNTDELMPSYFGNNVHLWPSAQSSSHHSPYPSPSSSVLPGMHVPERPFASSLAEKDAAGLTLREKEVLACLMKGASNKEIARELGVQVVTVKLHVRGICRKLGAKNRTQAALIARELRILET